MKIFDKLNINKESKIVVSGMIFAIIALFIVVAVVFLGIFATKLNLVMTQPANETYTYFISIADRILFIFMIFGILPLSCYQIFSKDKNKTDIAICTVVVTILLAMLIAFFGGEYYFYKKYKSGELNNAKIFDNQTIEMKIFDKI
jgi:uncharacterized membrane protein YwzB